MAVQTIYQFYAELEDFRPKIWRRFQTSGNVTVARLAYMVLTMFEMEASHLFAVEHECPLLTPSGRQSKRTRRIDRYEIPDKNDLFGDRGYKDARETKLYRIDFEESSRLVVWYDFGDDWRVRLTREDVSGDIAVPAKELPRVIAGAGYGIVEDCGGVWGLEDLVEAFKKKSGDEYEEYREWLGNDDFDVKAFDLDDMNSRLKETPDIYEKIYEEDF